MNYLIAIAAFSAVGFSGAALVAVSESDPLPERKTLAEMAPGEPVSTSSASAEALAPPAMWDCDLYVSEYQDFLDGGSSPAEWRFYGIQYVDALTGQPYTWNDWIDWANESGCVTSAFQNPEAAILAPAAIWPGLVSVGAPGVAAAAVSRGDSKSPG